jgi:hypothetical protein
MTHTIDMALFDSYVPVFHVGPETIVAIYSRALFGCPVVTTFDNIGRFTWNTVGVSKERLHRKLAENGEFATKGIRIIIAP